MTSQNYKVLKVSTYNMCMYSTYAVHTNLYIYYNYVYSNIVIRHEKIGPMYGTAQLKLDSRF